MPTPEQIERATLALKAWPVFVEDPLLADAVALSVLTAAGGQESASPSRVRAEVADTSRPGYTLEDVHLVALALENAGTALEDLPSYVEDRLAVAALEALAKAGRLLPEDTRRVAALHAEADRVHALGGEYNEAVAVGVRAAARMISEFLPEDTRTVAALVDEFHRRPGVDCAKPARPTVDVPGALDRVAYVEEEARELREAVESGDVVGAADALADLAYVVYGAAWRFGLPLDAVVAEVHRSNMTKTATPGDGKAIKGPGYSPPDVAGVLGVGPWVPVPERRVDCVACQAQRFHDRHQTAEELSAELAPLVEALENAGPTAVAADEACAPVFEEGQV